MTVLVREKMTGMKTRTLVMPMMPLSLPKYTASPDTLDLIAELGLSHYVDYDAMVCRRSERVKVPRVKSLYGEYVGPK